MPVHLPFNQFKHRTTMGHVLHTVCKCSRKQASSCLASVTGGKLLAELQCSVYVCFSSSHRLRHRTLQGLGGTFFSD